MSADWRGASTASLAAAIVMVAVSLIAFLGLYAMTEAFQDRPSLCERIEAGYDIGLTETECSDLQTRGIVKAVGGEVVFVSSIDPPDGARLYKISNQGEVIEPSSPTLTVTPNINTAATLVATFTPWWTISGALVVVSALSYLLARRIGALNG